MVTVSNTSPSKVSPEVKPEEAASIPKGLANNIPKPYRQEDAAKPVASPLPDLRRPAPAKVASSRSDDSVASCVSFSSTEDLKAPEVTTPILPKRNGPNINYSTISTSNSNSKVDDPSKKAGEKRDSKVIKAAAFWNNYIGEVNSKPPSNPKLLDKPKKITSAGIGERGLKELTSAFEKGKPQQQDDKHSLHRRNSKKTNVESCNPGLRVHDAKSVFEKMIQQPPEATPRMARRASSSLDKSKSDMVSPNPDTQTMDSLSPKSISPSTDILSDSSSKEIADEKVNKELRQDSKIIGAEKAAQRETVSAASQVKIDPVKPVKRETVQVVEFNNVPESKQMMDRDERISTPPLAKKSTEQKLVKAKSPERSVEKTKKIQSPPVVDGAKVEKKGDVTKLIFKNKNNASDEASAVSKREENSSKSPKKEKEISLAKLEKVEKPVLVEKKENEDRLSAKQPSSVKPQENKEKPEKPIEAKIQPAISASKSFEHNEKKLLSSSSLENSKVIPQKPIHEDPKTNSLTKQPSGSQRNVEKKKDEVKSPIADYLQVSATPKSERKEEKPNTKEDKNKPVNLVSEEKPKPVDVTRKSVNVIIKSDQKHDRKAKDHSLPSSQNSLDKLSLSNDKMSEPQRQKSLQKLEEPKLKEQSSYPNLKSPEILPPPVAATKHSVLPDPKSGLKQENIKLPEEHNQPMHPALLPTQKVEKPPLAERSQSVQERIIPITFLNVNKAPKPFNLNADNDGTESPPRPNVSEPKGSKVEYHIPIKIENEEKALPRNERAEVAAATAAAGQYDRNSDNYNTNTLSRRRLGSKKKRMSMAFSDSSGVSDEDGLGLSLPQSGLQKYTSYGKHGLGEQPLFRLKKTRPPFAFDKAESFSSGEDDFDDDDGFQEMTAENLFSTLLSRVKSLTRRIHDEHDEQINWPKTRHGPPKLNPGGTHARLERTAQRNSIKRTKEPQARQSTNFDDISNLRSFGDSNVRPYTPSSYGPPRIFNRSNSNNEPSLAKMFDEEDSSNSFSSSVSVTSSQRLRPGYLPSPVSHAYSDAINANQENAMTTDNTHKFNSTGRMKDVEQRNIPISISKQYNTENLVHSSPSTPLPSMSQYSQMKPFSTNSLDTHDRLESPDLSAGETVDRQRRVSRFLRPDFYDIPKEDSIYAKMKELEAEDKKKPRFLRVVQSKGKDIHSGRSTPLDFASDRSVSSRTETMSPTEDFTLHSEGQSDGIIMLGQQQTPRDISHLTQSPSENCDAGKDAATSKNSSNSCSSFRAKTSDENRKHAHVSLNIIAAAERRKKLFLQQHERESQNF